MTSQNGEKLLKKRIGFLGLLAMSVGLNIGGALFALTTVAAGLTGPSLPLAMIISSLPVMLAIVPYCILVSAAPTTSATYRYIQLFSPVLALISMLTLFVCILIGAQPLFSLAFGIYLQKIVPLDPIIAGVMVLTFFYIVNLVGIELTTKLQIALFFILISALLLFIVLGTPLVQAELFSNPFPKGFGGVLAASGLLFTFCSGGFFVIDLGGEVVQASRTFPRVLLLGMIIAVIFYIFIMIVTVGVVDFSTLEGKTLLHVAEQYMSKPMLMYFIIGGALVACATSINVIFTIVARGVLVLSEDGLLPSFLGKVNQRFGTPHYGLTFTYVVNVIALITIPSLMFFGSMLNLGLIFAITLVAVTCLVFPKRFPDLFARSAIKLKPVWRNSACYGVIVLNLLIFAFFTFAIGKASFVFFGIVIASTVYAYSRSKTFKQLKITWIDQ